MRRAPRHQRHHQRIARNVRAGHGVETAIAIEERGGALEIARFEDRVAEAADLERPAVIHRAVGEAVGRPELELVLVEVFEEDRETALAFLRGADRRGVIDAVAVEAADVLVQLRRTHEEAVTRKALAQPRARWNGRLGGKRGHVAAGQVAERAHARLPGRGFRVTPG